MLTTTLQYYNNTRIIYYCLIDGLNAAIIPDGPQHTVGCGNSCPAGV